MTRTPIWDNPRYTLILRLAPVVVGVIVLVEMILTGRQSGVAVGFPLDDAWIHMVYGRSLATEGLLAYNPGVAATGSTAPLWSAIVGLAHLLFQGISVEAVVIAVMAFGGLLHLATVWYAAGTAEHLTDNLRIGTLTGLLVAISPPLVAAALSGMETALAGLLLVVGIRAILLKTWLRAGLFLALACAARPEAAAVGLVAAGYAGWDGVRSGERLDIRAWAALILPAALLAFAWGGFNVLATGRLLPATFYFKQDGSLADLPGRLVTGLSALLGQVPPFKGWVAWVAVAGLFLRPNRRGALPFVAGFVFFVANLAVTPPNDPAAFYHLRYVLPAVPLLIIGLALGAHGLSFRLPLGARSGLPAALLVVGMVGTSTTFGPVARHRHNDVRNINEVQVSLGRWLDEHTRADAWIGTTDAGAVRYFARRPAIDLLGLNTPEFHWEADTFRRAHPVDAVAVMPAWVRPDVATGVQIYAIRETGNFTVTSEPSMAQQVVLGIPRRAGRDAAVTVAFEGIYSFRVDVNPGRFLTP